GGGIGAGVDVLELGKTTEASIGTAQLNNSAAPASAGNVVNAKRNVLVRAGSVEDLKSLAGAVGAGKSIGVAGGASAVLIDTRSASDTGNINGLITRAHIGDSAKVNAGANVL